MTRAARAALPALALLASGCAQTFDATKLGIPAQMSAAAPVTPGQPAVEGVRFAVGGKAVHAFWGLFTLSQPKLDQALAAQLVGGGEVRELRIRSRLRFWDIVATGLTLGVLAPRSVTYDGVVVGGNPPPQVPVGPTAAPALPQPAPSPQP
ncbi:MAG: hypothetical protein NW201_13775 [Gemmatimonadales bacterium]|nr:hypothetical protein [Gemmatimonadales bacterium]